ANAPRVPRHGHDVDDDRDLLHGAARVLGCRAAAPASGFTDGRLRAGRRSVHGGRRRSGRGAAQPKQSGPGVICIKPPTSPLGNRNNAYAPPPASVTSPKRNASLALRTPVE